MHTLALSDVCNWIGVHPPYFAFLELQHQDERAVRGTFRAEHQIGHEMGPISAAEVIRHLATLGACAAIVKGGQTTPTYYLGSKGSLKVECNTIPADASGDFHAFSEVVFQDHKSLVTNSTATSGEYFAHFQCEYLTLPSPVFARTFRHYRTAPVAPPEESPYRTPIALDFEAPQKKMLVARSQPLPNTRFAGHFAEYPAWPASLYGEAVSQVAGCLLKHMLDRDVRFTVARMDIDAKRLISGAEQVSFHVDCTPASKPPPRYSFRAEIRHKDVLVSVIALEVDI